MTLAVLLDSCLSPSAADAVREAGHDVNWVGAWLRDPGDPELLDFAIREGRVIVTLDKDFGELAVVRGNAHHGIVRLVGFRADEQGSAVDSVT